MKQKKMLALTPSQLKQLYRHELPELTGIAARSGDAQTFKTYLSEYMAGHPQAESEAGKLIRLLIDYDGQKYMNSQRTSNCLFQPSPYSMISSPANWKNTSKLTFSLIYSDNSNVCNTPNIPYPASNE